MPSPETHGMNDHLKKFLTDFLNLHLDHMPFAVGSGMELFSKPMYAICAEQPGMTIQEAARELARLADDVLKERLKIDA